MRGARTRESCAATRAAVLCLILIGSSACASLRLSSNDLSASLARAKELAPEAAPPTHPAGQTLETWDPRLAVALRDLAVDPSPAAYRQVADEYRRLGVLDTAHAHLTRALVLAPRDAGLYDARARVWREFGFPGLGLGDAYRAIHLAPASAEAVNTLGTLFEALGRPKDARERYERARQLDPGAAFPVLNLCHIDTMLGRRDAVSSCRLASALAPESRVARNNLGLAYAVARDFVGAHREFLLAGDTATAEYNMGIVYMAARRFDDAREAFRLAWKANPEFQLAGQRLRQLTAMSTE